ILALGSSEPWTYEGAPVTVSGFIDDPGVLDTHTVSLTWGDGATSQAAVDPVSRTFRATHTYADNGIYSVTASVQDDDGGHATGVAAVEIRNAAPHIVDVDITERITDEGSPVHLSGSFSDAGLVDTHQVIVDWGDGRTSLAVVDPSNRTFNAVHAYNDDDPTTTPEDDYIITVTVIDNAGDSNAVTYRRDVTHTLEGADAAAAAIANARSDDNLTHDVTLSFVIDGDAIAIPIPAGSFASAERLRAYLAETINAAIISAGAGSIDPLDDVPQLVSVFLTDTDAIGFAAANDAVDGLVYHVLEGATDADQLLNNARSGNAIAGTTFTVVLDGTTLDTSVSAANFNTSEELRQLVQTAVNTTLLDSRSFTPGSIEVQLDSNDQLRLVAGPPQYGPTSISIRNVTPVIDGLTNTAAIPGQVIPPNTTVTVTVPFIDPGVTDHYSWTITWGDGTETTGTLQAGPRDFQVSHAYSDPGIFDIVVTLTDDDGASTSDTTRAYLSGVSLVNGILYIIGTPDDNRVRIIESHSDASVASGSSITVHADFPINHEAGFEFANNPNPGDHLPFVFDAADVHSLYIRMIGEDDHDVVEWIGSEDSDLFIIDGDTVFTQDRAAAIFSSELELLRIDGAGGNDRLFVAAVSGHTTTEVYGGAGSDQLNLAGDVPGSTVDQQPIGDRTSSHNLVGIEGALSIHGGSSELTAADGSDSNDSLVVFHDEGVSQTGRMDASTLAGLAAHPVSYSGLEVFELLLGAGNDSFTIDNTADGMMTAVHGGGGDDHITVNSRGTTDDRGLEAPLVVFGDTEQNGGRYSGTAGIPQVGTAHAFANVGNDIIDASLTAQTVIISGGAGQDSLFGGLAGDHIAGGSGDDSVHGAGGDDILYGDAGINVDMVNRTFTVVSTASGNAASSDPLTPGADHLAGDDGADIIFGDYGQITQNSAVTPIVSTAGVLQAWTENPSTGSNDQIDGGNDGDVIFGGFGSDRIDGGLDNADDIVIGDSGRATFNGSETVPVSEQTGILSINFTGNRNGGEVTGTAGAAAARTSVWNNLAGRGIDTHGDEAGEALFFDNGALAAGMTIDWGRDLDSDPQHLNDDSHGQIDSATGPDQALFGNYLWTDANHTLGVNLAGMSEYFTDYDVYVYMDADSQMSRKKESVRRISSGGISYYLNDPDGQSFDGRYVEVNSTDPQSPQAGNYVVFHNLTANDFQLRIDDLWSDGSNKPAISAIQIVGRRHAVDRIETTSPEFGGDDIIVTGGGNDLVLGGTGRDQINTAGFSAAGTDNDSVVGDDGRVTLQHGRIVEIRTTSPVFTLPEDSLFNDVIVTGAGADVVLGGNGSDFIDTSASQPGTEDRDGVVGDNGIARLYHDQLVQLLSTDHAAVADGVQADQIITGDDFDVLIGGNGSDVLVAGAGNDVLTGDNSHVLLFQGQLSLVWQITEGIGGDDVLNGGSGSDLLYGQFGNDRYVFTGSPSGSDRLFESDQFNDAADQLAFRLLDGPVTVDLRQTSAQLVSQGTTPGSLTLILELNAANVFESVIGTQFSDDIRGNDRDNLLVGLNGDDSLQGRAGNDVLIGGRGFDDLQGDDGEDLLIGAATVHDDNPDNLDDVFALWTSDDDFAMRMLVLENDLLSPAKIVEDNAPDKLQGGQDRDWLFARSQGSSKDKLIGFNKKEDELTYL
ncbi:MAG: PKD domain-containing protein, partial [Planctomycetaceae bacterium]|nr:PKD domain-containing protein [Planctomycetaceae bacterium]